ncbi:uncharacterized protein YjbJ (UPF0337 family) [Sphingomonas insulae]|uniref:CsbD family protein n=1 Tax=Sphingomonas insulae TaxID=424800 RepID=A0ABP3T744_9SPHN|nr:CsbD family protein [Sphingomonas insulae]NIJ28825.1 uncharacterized protein YjbJ (UPF0337 family) [Sphingomonas insulae]
MSRRRNVPPEQGAPPARETPARDTAAAREARGSVHEAIGKLIGDDAASAHGKTEKHAGAAEGAAADPTPRD